MQTSEYTEYTRDEDDTEVQRWPAGERVGGGRRAGGRAGGLLLPSVDDPLPCDVFDDAASTLDASGQMIDLGRDSP